MNLATDTTTFRRKSREWFTRGFVSRSSPVKTEIITWEKLPVAKELRLEETRHALRDLLLVISC